jgi:hypothetical protein
MSYQRRRSFWVWRSLQRLWRQDTLGAASEGVSVAISAALAVTLAVLVVILLSALVVSMPQVELRHSSAATPLTAGTSLLGGASLVGARAGQLR